MALVVLILIALALLVQSDDDYELVTAENRNIIFVGRSRAGKTTLINVLKNKDYSPEEFDIIRETANASFETFTMNSESRNKSYHFNIIDTPGLFEKTLDINDRRTNKIILNMIIKCINMEITNINHIYFVMSIQHGLNPDDLKAFELFTTLFVRMEDKISIIISFAQELIEKHQYDHYMNQFDKVPELRLISDIISNRIYFVGAAQNNDMYDMDMIKKNVYKQRATLFEHIIQQNDTYNVKTLKVYQDKLRMLQRVSNSIDKCCKDKQSTVYCRDVAKFKIFIEHYMHKPDVGERINDSD